MRFAKLLFEAIDAFFERLYIFFRRRLEIQSARDGGLWPFSRLDSEQACSSSRARASCATTIIHVRSRFLTPDSPFPHQLASWTLIG